MREHMLTTRLYQVVVLSLAPLSVRGYAALIDLRFTWTRAVLLRGDKSLIKALVITGRATCSVWMIATSVKALSG